MSDFAKFLPNAEREQPAPNARIAALVANFNGAIKYAPMLADHPDWTDEQCLAFAKAWHAKAIAGLKEALARDTSGNGNWHNPPVGIRAWNHGIPYCRNLPIASMIEEALGRPA